jgi:GntR family transcriptional regulator
MSGRFRFHIFPSAGAPIYQQMIQQVKFQIASGRLAVGDYLPSVRDVAADLQVNPMTVSKAYSLLEREGILERDRGQGMRVVATAPKGGIRERREEIKDLLREVVVKAHQLGLDGADVWSVLKPMLAELDRSRPSKEKL